MFADDGTLVFSVDDKARRQLYRLDPGAGPKLLVDEVGSAGTPAPGGSGRVVFLHEPVLDGPLEVQSVATDGSGLRTEIDKRELPGRAWGAGGFLFTLRGDARAIKRRAFDGSADEALYEAPSGAGYDDLVVSEDARFVAVNLVAGHVTDATPVCIGEGAPGGKLDCEAAGRSTSARPAFSERTRGLYFARGDALVRFDLATRVATSHPLSPRATAVAIADGGKRLVFSTCQTTYDVVRLDDAGSATPLAGAATCAGHLAIGPNGALAFPVASGERSALALTDDTGAQMRALTTGDRPITDVAFSPDGSRIVFSDSSEDGGGLFLVDVAPGHGATRLTEDPTDQSGLWLDGDRMVFMRAEKGFPHGRAYLLSLAGGEPRPLPILPGTPLSGVPSRGTLIMIIMRVEGARFVESTLDGKTRELALEGAPAPIALRYAMVSPSGRYLTWIGPDGAWLGDLELLKAKRIPYTLPSDTASVVSDDHGHITIASRRLAGQLYDVRGSFP